MSGFLFLASTALPQPTLTWLARQGKSSGLHVLQAVRIADQLDRDDLAFGDPESKGDLRLARRGPHQARRPFDQSRLRDAGPAGEGARDLTGSLDHFVRSDVDGCRIGTQDDLWVQKCQQFRRSLGCVGGSSRSALMDPNTSRTYGRSVRPSLSAVCGV